jgi:hypothetical protein
VAGRPLARARPRSVELELSGIDAGHVCQLRARAGGRAAATGGGAGGRDRGSRRDPAAWTAADLPGRLRLPRVCAPGGRARAGPVYAFRRRSSHRPLLPVHRLAVSALPLRPAVHARELRAGAFGAGGRIVGVQSDRRPLRSRCGPAGCARRRAPRSLTQVGARVRRPEPRAARAGRWRSAQRHAGAGGARAGAGIDRRRESAFARRSGRARCGRGHQGDGRARTPVLGARAGRHARAPARGAWRRLRARRGGARRRPRLRRARARLPERGRRAAAARGHAQHSRGDRAPAGAERHPGLVAPSLCRRLRRSARLCVVAHRSRSRLARGRRLEHDRAARLDRVAVALVCDLGAAASGRQR